MQNEIDSINEKKKLEVTKANQGIAISKEISDYKKPKTTEKKNKSCFGTWEH
jgi:hypothetical protein